jgi:hypothetical protein
MPGCNIRVCRIVGNWDVSRREGEVSALPVIRPRVGVCGGLAGNQAEGYLIAEGGTTNSMFSTRVPLPSSMI